MGNRPVNFNDPSGHKGDDGCGAYGCPKENIISKIFSKFGSVDIKSPDDWKTGELQLLDSTLDKTLAAFGGNMSAFNNAFGPINFSIADLPEGKGGFTYENTGDITLGRWAFYSKDVKDFFGTNAWFISHEMGHLFDQRWTGSNPQKYFSNEFVQTLNNGHCAYLTEKGCLGSLPRDYTPWWDVFGLTTGNYSPSDKWTTPYALEGGSYEDFAESFAGVILGDPKDVIGASRERIIQIDIAVTTSYWQ